MGVEIEILKTPKLDFSGMNSLHRGMIILDVTKTKKKSDSTRKFTRTLFQMGGICVTEPLEKYRVIHEPLDTQFRQHRMRRCAVGCLFPVLPSRTSEVKRSCNFSMNFDRAANIWRSIDIFTCFICFRALTL